MRRVFGDGGSWAEACGSDLRRRWDEIRVTVVADDEFPFGGVDDAMALSTHEREVVQIGGAPMLPILDVVHLAPCRGPAAFHTASIADDDGLALPRRRESNTLAEHQRNPGTVPQRRPQRGVRVPVHVR
jgi:hypothetical protein